MQGLNQALAGAEPSRALLSHKLDCHGYKPSARYGHGIVSVSVGGKVALVLFGGIDKSGKYAEEVIAFDTHSLHWKLLSTSEETHQIHLLVGKKEHKPSKSTGSTKTQQLQPKTSSPQYNHLSTQQPQQQQHPQHHHQPQHHHHEVSSTQNFNISADLTFGKKPDKHVHSEGFYQAPKKVGQEGNEALGRMCHTMVVYNDSLYIFGGKNKFFLNDLWKFDFNDLKWEKLEYCSREEDKPCRRMGHTAVVYGGKMWVFGGFSSEGESLNDLWSYDFEKRTWQKVAYTGEVEPRYEHAADVVGDVMYVTGGKGNFTASNNQFLKYEFASNTWTLLSLEHGPSPRWGHATGVNSKALHIYGGFGEYRGYVNDCYEYEFATGVWQKNEVQGDAFLPHSARELHTLNFIGNRAYIFGGIGPDGVMDDMIELWDFNCMNC